MRRSFLALAVAPVLALGVTTVAGAAAPSPTTDDTSVVAQQLLTLAGTELHWELSTGAIAPDEVRVENNAHPTFVIVDSGAAIVTDVTPDAGPDAPVGDTVHLGPNEATFVNGGEATRFDADASGATYLALALAEGGADDGSLGDGFTPAAELHDVDLRGDLIAPGSSALMTDSAVGPTVVVVVSGTVDAGGPAFESAEPFAAGSGLAVEGDVLLTNNSDQPAYVVGTWVGPIDAGTAATTPPATEAPHESSDDPTTTSEAPTTTMPATDSDGDGLSDDEEAQMGTDPAVTDSDNDGLSDGDEVHQYGTNPTNPDTDGDMLVDSSELTNGWGCDPTKPDTDGDGYNDHDDAEGCADPNRPVAPVTPPASSMP